MRLKRRGRESGGTCKLLLLLILFFSTLSLPPHSTVVASVIPGSKRCGFRPGGEWNGRRYSGGHRDGRHAELQQDLRQVAHVHRVFVSDFAIFYEFIIFDSSRTLLQLYGYDDGKNE